ncbi:MAG: hypothetical protein ACI8XO_003443, partial [Verrucomicrobiales bacterium]
MKAIGGHVSGEAIAESNQSDPVESAEAVLLNDMCFAEVSCPGRGCLAALL